MTIVGSHTDTIAPLSPRPAKLGSAQCENWTKRRSIKVADCAVVHAWVNAKVPQTGKAPLRNTAKLEVRHDDAPAPPAGAIQADAMPKAAETAEATNARQDETFGIDADRLNADLVAGTKRFLNHYDQAKQREQAVKHRKHYQLVEVSYVRDDGSIDKEERFVRTKKTRAQLIQERNKKDGESIKQGYNHFSNWLHEKTGKPRKTGTSYGSRKANGSLVAPATLMPAEQSGVAVGFGKLVTGAVRGEATSEQPGLLPSLGAASDALALAGLPSVIADAIEGADGALTLSSTQAQAKANLLRCEDALRFRRFLGEATAAEAEAYLAFDTAGARLIDPTAEELAADAIAKDGALRNVVLQPSSTFLAGGAQIAGHVTPVSAAAVGVAAGPLSMFAGAFDLHQARQEYLRRVAQAAIASERKQVMASVLEKFKDRPDASVCCGAMASLDGQQDRLIRQAKREKGFAKIRGFRAGAGVAGGLVATVLAGVALGGLITVAALSPLAALLPVAALPAGAAIAWRNFRRHRAEHTSKWRQRAASAAVLGMTREELEQKLSLPAGDQAAEVTVTLGEGEYLADEDRFAGERTMTFNVRENEYVGLHIFALHIQDLVRGGDRKAAAAAAAEPWIATLKGMGVDSVRLLAICKAASAKPADQQLDFIKSHLAPALGMKYRMAGSRALPHPSAFLGPFRNALLGAGLDKNVPPSPRDYRDVRKELVAQFADGEEAMAAFKASTTEFLRKTEKLPSSPLRAHLQAFLAMDGLTAQSESGTTLPEIRAHQVVEFFRPAAAEFHTVHKKLKQHGFGEGDMAAAISLGKAGLSNLPAPEAARIEAQMNAFLMRVDRP